MTTPILLTDAQIQSYLINGYLTLQTAHDPAFHQQLHQQIESLYATTGNPSNDILPKVPELYQVLQDPAVHGALHSLLGPDYIVHPHRHCHQNSSGSAGQGMHQDSYENDQNVRHHRTRWAMAFYYPHDVTLDNGPSAILPATQYYTSAEQAHQREEIALCGKAGTVTIVHYDLWHRAMPNPSDRDRFMVKFLFTRMSEPQSPTWDHRDDAWTAESNDPPALLCRRAWDWMRGAETTTAPSDTPTAELAQALQTAAEAERLHLDINQCRRHWKAIHDRLGEVEAKAIAVFEARVFDAETDAEAALYDGFVSDDDRKLADQVRRTSAADLADGAIVFADNRLNELLFRYRARHFPETLVDAERDDWNNWLSKRLEFAPDGGLTVDDYDEVIAQLMERVKGEPAQLQLLLDLKAWSAKLRQRL